MTDAIDYDKLVNDATPGVQPPPPVAPTPAPAEPAAAPIDYDKLVGQTVEQRNRQQFLENLKNSRDIIPEKQAQAISVAQTRGVPVGVAYKYLDELQPKPTPFDYDSMSHKAPVTAKLLADPVKGPVAFPDGQPLADIEQQLAAFTVKHRGSGERQGPPAPATAKVSFLTPEQSAAEQAARVKAAAEALQSAANQAIEQQRQAQGAAAGFADFEAQRGNPGTPDPMALPKPYADARDAMARSDVISSYGDLRFSQKVAPTQSFGTSLLTSSAQLLASTAQVIAGLGHNADAAGSVNPISGAVNYLADKLGIVPRDEFGRDPVTAWLDSLPDTIDRWFPQDPGRSKDVTNRVVGSIMGSLPMVVAGLLTRGKSIEPEVMAGLVGMLQQGGQGAQDAIDHGASPEMVNLTTLINDLAGVSEMVPFSVWAGAKGGGIRGFLNAVAEGALTEAPQNMGQQLIPDLWAKYFFDLNRDTAGNLSEAAKMGLAVGGIFGGFFHVVNSAAEANHARLLSLSEAARKLRLAGLSRSILDEAIGNMPGLDAVKAPIKAVETLFQEAGPDALQQFPETARSLEEARAHQGGDPNATAVEVTIPKTELVRLGLLKGFDEQSKDMRVGDDLTFNEKMDEAKKLLTDLGNFDTSTPATPQEDSPFFKGIREQLTKTGYSPDAATALARIMDAFITTAAERSGGKLTATDIARRYGVEISNSAVENAAGATTLQQEPVTNTPEFKAWFGDSKVVDEQGAPIVVYHGTDQNFSSFRPGSFFTSSPELAAGYGEGAGQNVVPAYLSIKNPASGADVIRVAETLPGWSSDYADEYPGIIFNQVPGVMEALKKEGFDGAAFEDGPGGMSDAPDAPTYVAFDPTQIKSVNNRGTFDPSNPNILYQGAEPTVEGQSSQPGNKHGFAPYLRVETGVEIPKGKKPLFAQVTMNSTAPRQIAAIDEVLARHPNATSSVEAWNAMMSDALASNDVPLPPYAFIANLNGDGSRKLLEQLSPGQIADADHGFKNAADFRQAYTNGEISIEDTGRLFLWSFLSRGVSPYTQESLFIDSFDGIDQWIQAAADGTLKDKLGEYEAWAKTAAPQGSGQPGAGATHNLNAFGKLFLLKMSEDAGDGTGRSRLQVLHDMMSDPNSTGRDIRRKFLEMGEGVGIDNKVVSFTLLVAGFTDVMVLDRVQIRELWNDGRFDDINLYDGYKVDGKPVTGSALSNLTYGARGLLIYEAIEQGLKAKVGELYAQLGRPEAASPGRYHWETWVASSNQEASHATIDAILARAKGAATPLAGVTAKEGEYGAFAYGARYGRDGLGKPYFLYSVPGVGDFKFSVPAFRDFLDQIKVKSNGIIPGKFKVTESGNGPWYNRPEVNLAKLGELAGRVGERFEAEPLSGADAARGIDPPIANRLAADQPGASPAGGLAGQVATEAPSGASSASETTLNQANDPAFNEPAIQINGQVMKASDFFPNWPKGSRPGAGNGMSIADEQAMSAVDLGPGMPEDPFWGHAELRKIAAQKFGADVVNKQIEADPENGFGFVNAAGDFKNLKGATLNQNTGDVRGSIQFTPLRDKFRITLTEKANLSTFIHEGGHFFLEVLQDLVNRGEASAQQVADLKTLKRWMGLKDGEAIDRNGHEKFARTWEQYIMEGKAPSLALHGIFQKFKAWMIFVYKRLANVRGDLNDEIRTVMDRLVASDAAIAEARTMVGWRGAPMSQEETGLDAASYQAYVAQWTKANDAQSADADARIMLEAARELKRTWAEEKTKVTKQVEEELAQTRGWQAWKLLENGEGIKAYGRTTIKIDPTTIPKGWGADTKGITASADQGGMDLDMVAELLGFDTGEQMLQSIGGAKLAQKAIPARVRQIMVERHGEMDAAGLAQEAMKAVHNTPTMDVLLTEFRALAAKANLKVGKDTGRMIRAAAEERVAQIPARQLDPAKWRRAEVKAAEEAGKLAAKGKDNEAALAKRRQMMAAAMARASLEAQDRIGSIKDYLSTFTTNRRRAALGKAGDTYLDQVDGILEAIQFKDVSLKAIKARQGLAEFVKQQEAAGEPVFISDATRDLLGRKNYTEMTLEELEGVHDAVKNLWTVAKEINTVRKGAEKIALEKALEEITAETEATLPEKKQRDHLNPTKIDKMMEGLSRYHAGNLKIEFITDWLGKTAHRLIYQPISDAAYESWKLHRDLTAPFMDKLRDMPAEQKKRWNTKRQFLNYPIPLKGANIWMIALNLGNAGNKEKMLAGYGWTERDVMAELATFMTKEDWDLVQETWDTIDKMWPRMSEVVKRATGLEPPKVEAVPIDTPFGQYKGGYFPVVYDRAIDARMDDKLDSSISPEEMFSKRFTAFVIDNGFTKGRTGNTGKLLFDPNVISQHLGEVIHYATHYEAVKQADKIIRAPAFKALVKTRLGDAVYAEMKQWLKDVASNSTRSDRQQHLGDRFFRWARSSAQLTALGFNIKTILKQPMGIVTTLDALKAKHFWLGIQKAWLSPYAVQNWKDAFAKSKELGPLVKNYDRDLATISRSYADSIGNRAWEGVYTAAFTPIAVMQSVANVAAWHGAYSQATEQGMSEKDAIDFADKVVRTTQGSGALKDLSGMQRGGEANKFFTMFYSYFGVLYNRLADVQVREKGVRNLHRKAGRLMVLLLMNELLNSLFDEGWDKMFPPDKKKDENTPFLARLALNTVDSTVNTLPIVRYAYAAMTSIIGGGQLRTPPAFGGIQKAISGGQALRGILFDDKNMTRAKARNIVALAGILSSTPVYGIYRTIDYAIGGKIFEE